MLILKIMSENLTIFKYIFPKFVLIMRLVML